MVRPMAPKLQRADGRLCLNFRHRVTGPYAHTQFQEGAAKVRLPKVEGAGPPEAVLINTAGGLTGGDTFTVDVTCEAKAAATLTSQASEKVYRSLGNDAVIRTSLTVNAHAALEWLPQETILFHGGRLRREITVRLAKNATFLGVESVVFGRTAMGETVREGALHERWRLYRQSDLLFADDTHLEGNIAAQINRPFVAKGHRANATLLYVAPDAEDMAQQIQNAPSTGGGMFSASARDGLMVARFLNVTGQKLRGDLTFVLGLIRSGRPLPKVWSC